MNLFKTKNMNELMELTENKTLPELKRELKFQLSKGEKIGGVICSHIISEINKAKINNFLLACETDIDGVSEYEDYHG